VRGRDEAREIPVVVVLVTVRVLEANIAERRCHARKETARESMRKPCAQSVPEAPNVRAARQFTLISAGTTLADGALGICVANKGAGT